MVLHLKKVSKYVNKLIKSKKGYEFPNWNLTKNNNFWFNITIGARGSGKTNAILSLLKIEEDGMLTGDNHVYWVSPTHDPKVEEFAEKYGDNMTFYDDLNIKTFNEVIETIREKTLEWKQKKYIFDLFEKYLKDGENSLQAEEVEILYNSGMMEEDIDHKELIDDFNHIHPPRHSLIIDDSMGSPLISSSQSKQGKEFVRWAIRHRHDFTNLFILAQAYRGISLPLRTNANNIILFPSKDRATSKSIFDEFSSVFDGKRENYIDTLDMLDKTPVGDFLFIYYDNDKFLRLGFDRKITFKDADTSESEGEIPKKELTI
jgi:hypothetical protein